MLLWLLLLLLFLLRSSTTSALQLQPKHPQHPIRKVAVIGAGIAGLSLAHALENNNHNHNHNSVAKHSCKNNPVQVTLFEARPSSMLQTPSSSSSSCATGAGVQLNGGMAALHRIHPNLHRAVADAALPLRQIRSRTKKWNASSSISSSNTRTSSHQEQNDSNTMEFDELLSMTLPDIAREVGGTTKAQLLVNGESMFVTILRSALQQALWDALPVDIRESRTHFEKSLTGVTVESNGENGSSSIRVGFGDGSVVGGFDMVVGCDGIKTAVKEYMETGRISVDASRREGRSVAIYSGIRVKYAIQDGTQEDVILEEETSQAELRQYFGEGAYALSGLYGAGPKRPPTKAAFVISLDNDYIGPFKKPKASSFTVAENADWKEDERELESTRDSMLAQIRNSGIPDLDVGPIISNANRFFELGVYFHNPFSFGGWSKQVPGTDGRFCVLCGDAAHAMPPFLGQGANQAIQDAYLLAKQIHEYNADIASVDGEPKDLESRLKEYERVRWTATTNISAKSAALGYLEASSGPVAKFRDLFFRTLGALGVAKRVYLDAATPKLE